MNSTGGSDFAITIHFRNNTLYTEVVFLDFDEWINNENIVPKQDAICVGNIIDGEAIFYFGEATAPKCAININTEGVSNCCDAVDIELCYFNKLVIDTDCSLARVSL